MQSLLQASVSVNIASIEPLNIAKYIIYVLSASFDFRTWHVTPCFDDTFLELPAGFKCIFLEIWALFVNCCLENTQLFECLQQVHGSWFIALLWGTRSSPAVSARICTSKGEIQRSRNARGRLVAAVHATGHVRLAVAQQLCGVVATHRLLGVHAPGGTATAMAMVLL